MSNIEDSIEYQPNFGWDFIYKYSQSLPDIDIDWDVIDKIRYINYMDIDILLNQKNEEMLPI